MKNNSFEEIYDKLKNSKNVLISLHTSPDGDSLGSCVAMKHFLERDFNSNVRLVSGDEISSNLKDLEISQEVEFDVDISDLALKGFDLIIVLDSAIPDRVGSYKKDYTFPEEVFILQIDHHEENRNFSPNMRYVDSSAVSTCSILLNFFKDLGVKLDSKLIFCLGVGIITDSLFLTTNTSNKALTELNFLSDKGLDYFDLIKKTKLNLPLNVKKYLGMNLVNFEQYPDLQFGLSLISFDEIKDLGLNVSEIRWGVNELREIKGFDFVCNVVEFGDGWKGSFRSNHLDVSLMANELGGGGHKAAAGFYLDHMSKEEVKKRILDVVKKFSTQ